MATVKLPTQLRDAAGGAAEAEASGGTVGEVLEALYAEHGELRERISDADGGLRRFVNVYIRGEDIRFLDGLDTEVGDVRRGDDPAGRRGGLARTAEPEPVGPLDDRALLVVRERGRHGFAQQAALELDPRPLAGVGDLARRS